MKHGMKIGGVLIDMLGYANDTDQTFEAIAELQRKLDCLSQVTRPFGMEINANKTKFIAKSSNELENPTTITIDRQRVVTVDHLST